MSTKLRMWVVIVAAFLLGVTVGLGAAVYMQANTPDYPIEPAPRGETLIA